LAVSISCHLLPWCTTDLIFSRNWMRLTLRALALQLFGPPRQREGSPLEAKNLKTRLLAGLPSHCHIYIYQSVCLRCRMVSLRLANLPSYELLNCYQLCWPSDWGVDICSRSVVLGLGPPHFSSLRLPLPETQGGR
jgi:hypothetical protein